MRQLEPPLDPEVADGEFITAVPAAERWGIDLVSQGIPDAAGVTTITVGIMDADLPGGYHPHRCSPGPTSGHRHCGGCSASSSW